MKKAFTLAEVLVTLGIIGIVAAMTLPAVINKYKQKQLEVTFNKASAIIENALHLALSEYSLEYMAHKKGANGQLASIPNEDRAAINDKFKENLKITKIASIQNGACIDSFSCKLIANNNLYSYSGVLIGKYQFNGFQSAYDNGKTVPEYYILVDGMSVGQVNFQHHGVKDGLKVTFDTNGPFKGPNRYGYDIFVFNSGYYWAECCGENKSGCSSYINYGCYNYAKANQNPADSSKGYWETLY